MMTSWTPFLLCALVAAGAAAKGATKCNKGWKAFGSSCYTPVTKSMNFRRATETCRRMYAKLAEINTNEESWFLVKTFGPVVGDGHAWVRIAVANGNGTRMIPARIIRHAKRYKLGLIGVGGQEKKQLICEQDRGAKGKQKEDKLREADEEKRQREATRGKHCAPGWGQRGMSCYKMVYATMSFQDAQKTCSKMKARLADINSVGEMWHLLYRFGKTDVERWVSMPLVYNGKRTDNLNIKLIPVRKTKYRVGLFGIGPGERRPYVCEQPAASSINSPHAKEDDDEKKTSEGDVKDCGVGWKKYNAGCYRLFTSAMNFHQAHQACTKHNASLAELNGKQEIDFLLKTFGPSRTVPWVKMQIKATENEMETIPTRLFHIHNHNIGIYGNKQSDPREKAAYVCERELRSACWEGWERFKDRCYRYVPGRYPFEWSENWCRKHNAHLASVNSEQEMNFLMKYAKPTRWTCGPWIGMKTKDTKTFTWFDHSSTSYKPPTRVGERRGHNGWVGRLNKWKKGRRSRAKLRFQGVVYVKGVNKEPFICERGLGIGSRKIRREPKKEERRERDRKKQRNAHCEKGWWSYGGHCYLVIKKEKQFNVAEKTCVGLGGHLASANSKLEFSFLLHIAPNSYSKRHQPPCGAWLGMKINPSDKPSRFTWTDGSRTEYKPPGEYRGDKSQIVARLVKRGRKGSLNDVEPTRRNPFICERVPENGKKEKKTFVSKEPGSTCGGEGWRSFKNHCYKLFKKSLNFYSAEAYCVKKDAHLASANSKEEFNMLGKMTPLMRRGRRWQRGTWSGMHISHHPKVFASFKWTDGSDTSYTPPGEYNNIPRGAVAARMVRYTNGKVILRDMTPGEKNPFICERAMSNGKSRDAGSRRGHWKKKRHGHNPTYKRRDWHKKEKDVKDMKHQLGRKHKKDIKEAKVTVRKAHDRSDERKAREPESKCPREWKRWSGYCYKYFAKKLSFRSAEGDCREYGRSSHLSSIHSETELKMLMDMIPRTNATKRRVLSAWVGMTIPKGQRPGNVAWKWTDGTSAAYKPPRKLDLRPQGADAARLVLYKAHDRWESKGVYDTLGALKLPYICKRKPGK